MLEYLQDAKMREILMFLMIFRRFLARLFAMLFFGHYW